MSDIENNHTRPGNNFRDGQAARSTAPSATWRALDRRLPANMVVTIDGAARTGKNTSGELLAIAMGGVVVDSGRFYRSLTQACLLAGVNLDDAQAVADFCSGARVSSIVRGDKRGVFEALTTVDGVLFTKETLLTLGGVTPKVAQVPKVRSVVNGVLQRICGNGRYVVLGRDMGTAVFPETRYKFFFTADPTIREIRDSGSSAGQSVAKRDRSDARQTLVPENATVIDTGSKSPEEVLVTMLDDVIGRTLE